MYGSELGNFSFWWIVPIFMMILCFLMMGGKMKSMMELCCGSKTSATEEDSEFQKEQAGETEATEKKGSCP